MFLKPQKRKFFRHVNSNPAGQLLEIGVGNGAHLRHYSSHRVTGIDTSIRMLNAAREHAAGNINLLQMDGEKLLFRDESFDYVVLSHVIAVVKDPDRLIGEVLRVLKPGGKVFILNHFTPDNLLGTADRMFSRVSRLLHFRSSFGMSSLDMQRFQLLSEINADPLSYFKILTYEKKL